MSVFLFPGQGSQFKGMGHDLYQSNEEVKKLFEEADDLLKFSLSKIMFEGDEEALKQTKVTQPAIFLHSIAELMVYESKNNKPLAVAGHSLGEYSALVCANSLNFQDALFLLNERGKAMQNAVPVGEGLSLIHI